MKKKLMTCVMLLLLGLIFSGVGYAAQNYDQAPTLEKKVEQGNLPPVKERLPDEVEVVEPVNQVGEYGGTWNRFHALDAMWGFRQTLVDPLVIWNRKNTGLESNLVKNWHFEEEGTVLVTKLRKEIKWSDGNDFTADDIIFWWRDLASNDEYHAVVPPEWARGLQNLVKVNDYKLRWEFKDPKWIVPYRWTSGFWGSEQIITPAHYLKKFHPKYNSDKTYDELTQANDYMKNPDRPTVYAWELVEAGGSGHRRVWKRNPYYWKVDTEGNQLPYINKIVSVYTPETETKLLKVAQGEIDFQVYDKFSLSAFQNLPYLMQNRKRGNYRIVDGWKFGIGSAPVIVFNWNTQISEAKRKVIHDKRFRRAMSLAIDRKKHNQLFNHGVGRPQQATISKQSLHFQSEKGKKLWKKWANSYAEFDIERANKLLDQMGLTEYNDRGYRLLPNGKELKFVLYTSKEGDEMATLAKNWEKIGVNVIPNNVSGAQMSEVVQSNEWAMRARKDISETNLWTFPDWVFPVRDSSWFAPASGQWFQTGGDQGIKPKEESPIRRLQELYKKGTKIPDIKARNKIVHKAVKIHINEGPFYLGVVGGQRAVPIAKNYFKNIPNHAVIGPWANMTPSNLDPCQFYIDKD